MKKFLALTLAALLLLCMVSCGKDDEPLDTDADDVENDAMAGDVLVYGDFEYGVNESGDYEILGYTYNGSAKIDVEIPSSIDGRPVTGIADDAFKAITSIKSVTIPDSITYIGNYAFFDCDYVTELVIPSSVASIGVGAFMECAALEKVTLPEGLTEIANYTFMYCESLKDIKLPETLTAIGDGAFWKCDAITEVTVPASVKTIGDTAFIYCENLASVTLLATDVEIGEWAFGEYGTDTVLKGVYSEAAAEYAKNTGITFEDGK